MRRSSLLFSAAAVAMVSFSGGAVAQTASVPTASATGFGDVVVTARRRQEQMQTVPVAVTVLKQETFDRQGAYSPYTLVQDVPGFHVVTTSAAQDSLLINIRGQVQSSGTLFPSVIPYYAETPQPRGLAVGQFFDLENIQVLRGPQGVRFGRVTDGGAVLFSPQKPREGFGGYVQVKAGDYSMHGIQGALNIPIVADKVLFRAAFDSSRRDGYTDNLITGKALDDVHYDTQRLSLIVRPFEGLENYTTAQYQNINQIGTSQVPVALTPGTLATAFPYAPALAAQYARGPRIVENGSFAYGPSAGLGVLQNTFYLSNITTYELNENISFKNVAGYSTFKQRQGIDDDGTALPIIDIASRYLPISSQAQWSEEFQVNGKFFDDRLSATLGFYADQQKPKGRSASDIIIFAAFEQSSAARIKSDSRAVYGSFEYDLRDFVKGLKINGGMRYTKDKVVGDSATYLVPLALTNSIPWGICTTFAGVVCAHNELKSNATTWEAGATYQATDNIFLYASGRRGYRGGGISSNSFDPNHQTYQPEYDTEVEIGLKADWDVLGMKARTNFALFHDDLKRAQKTVTQVSGGVTNQFQTNAADAEIQGLEFEGKLIPIDGLTLGLNYAFTDAQYKKDASLQALMFNPVNGICNFNAPSPPPAGDPDFCPYNAIQGTPKHQATLNINYVLPLDVSLGDISIGGDYTYQSRQVFNDVTFGSPTTYQAGFGLMNLHASWDNMFGRPVDLGFFVTNVTDKVYRIGSVDLAKVSNTGYNIVTYAEPRMFGASLKYRFGVE